MKTRNLETIFEHFEKFRIEGGAITGILLGKVFSDYLISKSFSILLVIVAAALAFCNLVVFSLRNKINYTNRKEKQTSKST